MHCYMYHADGRLFKLNVLANRVLKVRLVEQQGEPCNKDLPWDQESAVVDAWQSLRPEVERGTLRTARGADVPLHADRSEQVQWLAAFLRLGLDEADAELDVAVCFDDYWMVRARCGEWFTAWVADRHWPEALRMFEQELPITHPALRQASYIHG